MLTATGHSVLVSIMMKTTPPHGGNGIKKIANSHAKRYTEYLFTHFKSPPAPKFLDEKNLKTASKK